MMDKAAFLHAFMDEIWNRQQFERIAHYVHERYTIHLDAGDPWEGKTIDHSTFAKRLHHSFDSFPNIYFRITTTIADGNRVAISWVMKGTNTGPIAGFPPTQKAIETKGMTIYHFTDDLISGHTQVFDRMTVMRQLGFA